MIWTDLFWGFFRVGCFSFGGAYGAIPLIRDVVRAYGWLSDEDLTYMIAVSESTPGPIMVNLATYVGSDQAGLPGALLATLAVVLPSFLIILLVTAMLGPALKNRYVQAVLGSVKPCVAGIILATGIGMVAESIMGSVLAPSPHMDAMIMILLLLSIRAIYRRLRKRKMSSIMLILTSAALGMLIYL